MQKYILSLIMVILLGCENGEGVPQSKTQSLSMDVKSKHGNMTITDKSIADDTIFMMRIDHSDWSDLRTGDWIYFDGVVEVERLDEDSIRVKIGGNAKDNKPMRKKKKKKR